MSSKISPQAIVEDGAVIGENVEIAPFCFISKDAKIGDGTTIAHNTCIYGKTTIGKNNKIFSHAAIGSVPQDLKFKGEDVELIIGAIFTFLCLFKKCSFENTFMQVSQS